jgi:hypothetical protein
MLAEKKERGKWGNLGGGLLLSNTEHTLGELLNYRLI